MKRFIVLILYAQLHLSICNAQYLRRESNFFPCLDAIVNDYYDIYFKFPTNIKDLITLTEYSLNTYPDYSACKENLIGKILPYLKKNRKHISIEEGAGYTYTIQVGNDTLLYVSPSFWPFSPCDDSLFIGGDPKEYYHFYDHWRSPRFFSSQNKAILYPDSVYQEFKKEIKSIQHECITPSKISLPYKYYVYENDTVPIYSMLEYNLKQTLHYYCNGQQINSQLPIYQKLESFLKSFCKEYKCRRILFMIPDYNI